MKPQLIVWSECQTSGKVKAANDIEDQILDKPDADYLIAEIDPAAWVEQIDRVMKSAYRKEADLLGVADFPPLERSADDLATCGNRFVACCHGDSICGVVELERARDEAGPMTTIASLAVDPAHFRAGIGRALVLFVLNDCTGRVRVTTGAKNLPAIRLYEGLGCGLAGRFETPDGVAMVAYLRGPSTSRAPLSLT